MDDAPRLGARIRALRRQQGLSQVQLAERLGISPSYLNLIEHNRRPLTAPLLIQLAADLPARPEGLRPRRRGAARRRPPGGVRRPAVRGARPSPPPTCASWPAQTPDVARAVLTLYHAYSSARESAATLAERSRRAATSRGVERSRLPSEEVSDSSSATGTTSPSWRRARRRSGARRGCDGDDLYQRARRATSRTRTASRCASRRSAAMRGAVRRYDPERRVLHALRGAAPRQPQLPARPPDRPARRSRACSTASPRDPQPHHAESRALCRVALANYFAGAVLMPYEPFLRGGARRSATTSSCSATASARASSRSATA